MNRITEIFQSITKSVLAEKMGMTNTTFNKKLKKDSFADEEMI
jgi:hypothetical protein